MIGNDKFVRLFGSTPAGDDELLIRIVAEAVREGVAIVLNRPGTKIPCCTLSSVERNRADKKAREQAAAIGDVNWAKRHHLCGLYHALTVRSLTGTDELPEGVPAKVNARVGTIIRRLTKLYGGKAPNIGVELGLSRMLVVDVDTTAEKAGFKADWERQTSNPLPGMTVASPGLKSVDGEWVHKHGGHYWFTLPDDVELPGGQGALKDESGYVLMWSKHQVLVPPSHREEGAYELIGQIEESEGWMIAKIIHESEARMKRAASRVLPDGTGDIDTWAFETPWADILEPEGWINTGIPDNCSCDTWTAPGPHGSTKSATAHDIGCSRYDTQTSPPLHVWTDNPPDWMADAIRKTGSKTFTKLRFLASREHAGDQKALLVAMGFNHASASPASDFNDWSPERPSKPVATKPAPQPSKPSQPGSDAFEGADAGSSMNADTEAENGTDDVDIEETVTKEVEDTDSWRPIDLSMYMDQEETQPSLMPRMDGLCLLYPGLVHSIHGEAESGKSWILQAEVVRLAKLGETSLFLDFENDPKMVVHRFMALGASREDLRYIDYRNPDMKPDLGGIHWRSMFRTPVALAVIDGMTDALGLFSLGSKDNDEIALFLRKFRQLARNTGAPLVIIDHVTKDKNSRGRYAIGGERKMTGLDGAAYVVDVVAPLGRGMRGVLKISVAKDKPGFIRPKATGFNSERLGEIARFVLDATGDKINYQLQLPEDPFQTEDITEEVERNEGLETLILEELSLKDEGLSASVLATRIGKRKADVLTSLRALESDGSIGQKPSPAGPRGRMIDVWMLTESDEDQAGESGKS